MLDMYEIDEIRIRTKTRVYVSMVAVWKEKGIPDTLRDEDGKQVFLPVEYMMELGEHERDEKK